ncbi:DNA cytosine methyltransferase [Trueperella pyogenes]|uniref:DNA cytosine methyltransferase n=1 Tax=Trueperella pyogenes TaxID=1661 RepID=UPI000E0D580C|nr:DNA cytosine methyltransferase [Trueperella pyogenes]
MKSDLTYVSLFSAAGLGCYGFKQAGFKCVGTAELLSKRLEVQKANGVCEDESAYYLGDLSSDEFLDAIAADVLSRTNDLTFVAATPPCQGMSVANHKKGDELNRNSLVVKSLAFISKTNPRFFVLENVRAFLTATCVDTDGVLKPISEAIDANLSGRYSILKKVVNLKDYGAPSSRTRTLVVGVRRDIHDITPSDIFPSTSTPPTLQELIGHLPSLTEMGEISPDDIFHSFRPYDARMRPWISGLKPGESAFENEDPLLRPHRVVNGEVIENKNSNGDKYQRNRWEKVAPCVHTRNDILASQATVHPVDDRVFSVRELCLMMGVPEEFRWAQFSLSDLNRLPLPQKQEFIREHDTNIRQCLGEGVPTPVFRAIANKARSLHENGYKSQVAEAITICERNNPRKKELAAHYTRQDTAFSLVDLASKFLPNRRLKILEPSVGVGAFLPALFAHFDKKPVELDLIDLDPTALNNLNDIFDFYPENFSVRQFNQDYFNYQPVGRYDLIIGNPPFGSSGTVEGQFKLKDLYAKFIAKSLELSDVVAFVIPKSFLSGKEYALLRAEIQNNFHIAAIEDYAESAFSGIKIETIGIVLTKKKPSECTIVRSRLFYSEEKKPQEQIVSSHYPSWLIYRDTFFDAVAQNLRLGIFDAYRDRSITKAKLGTSGKIPVLKAKNIKNDCKESDADFYCDADSVPPKFWNLVEDKTVLVVPNLSYYPRACILPQNTYVDGSAALLIPKDSTTDVSSYDYFASPEFFYFYRVARNYSVRSLNIDSISAYYWGLPKSGYTQSLPTDAPTPSSKTLFLRLQ